MKNTLAFYYQNALTAIQSLAKTKSLQVEKVSIEHAIHRVLAHTLLSPESVPSFHNSSMDGFAIRSENTSSASQTHPIRLKVTETIGAGEASQRKDHAEFSCVEIMTGAPLPESLNAVVKIEDVQILQDSNTAATYIEIIKPVPLHENIRHKGEDFIAGQILLHVATFLKPEHLMVLAALGQSEVCVFKKPQVVVISTGKELVPYQTEKLQFSQIRNSTGLYLVNYLKQLGCEVELANTIPDDQTEFINLLQIIEKSKPDVIVTTGAVSKGKYDFIRPALEEVKSEILFHNVAIRPGKPMLFAKMKSGIAFFGLPGNPIATAVGARFFLTPYLRALLQQSPEVPIKSKLTENAAKPEGLRCFFKARVHLSNSSVECLPGQASFMLSPLTQANAWVVFPEESSFVPQNTEVDVYLQQSVAT